MRKRTLIAVAVGLACTLVPIARVGAKDKTIFIELELRSGGLPSAVNAETAMPRRALPIMSAARDSARPS